MRLAFLCALQQFGIVVQRPQCRRPPSGAVQGAIPRQVVCPRVGRVGHSSFTLLIRLHGSHVVPWYKGTAEACLPGLADVLQVRAGENFWIFRPLQRFEELVPASPAPARSQWTSSDAAQSAAPRTSQQ